jgi:membrane protease YdiL (CAAX protease family)
MVGNSNTYRNDRQRTGVSIKELCIREKIMHAKKIIVIIAPPILIAVMYPIFQLFAGIFSENWRTGWFLGLVIYWLLWGAAFPMWAIGKEKLLVMVRPRRPDIKIVLLVAFPLLMAALYRFIPGMEYKKESVLTILLLFSTAFGNGFFEEVLWRGVYMQLFPENYFFRIIWPSTWFALWHYVPGSVSPSGNVIGLIIGAGFLGFYSSYLAKWTNTIWWSIVAHTFGGIIMVC